MFDNARQAWQLRRLIRERNSLARKYDQDITTAKRKHKGHDSIEKIESMARFELNLQDDEIEKLRTRHLITKARGLLIPIPPHDAPGAWEESEIDRRWHLTADAQRALIVAIRAEQRDRSEIARLWLTGLTGLVGALSGLAALLFRK
jgi:hypothetical protein